MRAIWKGALTFGLVNVPVKLYAATEDHDVSLHQVHDADGGRIRYQRTCEICGEVVAFKNIDKAFDDGERTVVLTAEDLSAMPAERSREIEVMEFVPSAQVDSEPEHLAAARQSFLDAKIPAARTRFITGRAASVLPRMNEASYDLVLVDADRENVIEYVEHGLRLARAGGTVLVPRALNDGRVADPVQRDDITRALRSLIQETQQSPAVIAALSIVGDGLLQLTKVTA